MRTARHLLASVLLACSFAPSLQAASSPVGSTSGQFEVNANGAATYTVPLQVPPGVNGIEPKLALVYNSQQGNGLLGVGWSLSGLSIISRCPATIAVDGARSAINFGGSQFCWNGQRLIAKTTGGSQDSGTDTFGAYWEFHTELESFARIRAYASLTSPGFFKIWTNDGRILSFGATPDSNVSPQSKGTLIWALNREEDHKGNYLTVTYGTTADDSEYYPATIQYGGVTGLGTRSVAFGMDSTTRADIITKYVSGAKVVTAKRLKTIATKFGANTVRTYTINYTVEDTAAARSLIQSVQECGSDGACYTNQLTLAARSAGTTGFTNGQAASLTAGVEFGQWNQVADINGDGLMDIFKVLDAAAGRVAVALGSAGGGFGADVTTTGVITNETTSSGGFNQWNELADMNGDGIMDIFRVMPAASGTVAEARVYLGNANGLGGFSTTPITLSSAVTYGVQGFRFWNQLIDMNGDGLADIFRVLPNTQKFAVNYGYLQAGAYKLDTCLDTDPSCWITGLAISNNSHGFRQSNQLADMNGDGVIDLFRVLIPNNGADPGNARNVNILFGMSLVNTTVPGGKLAFSTLAGDQSNVVTPITFSNAKHGGYFNFYNQLVDVNGDGLPDIVRSQPVLDAQGNPGTHLDVLVAKRNTSASAQSMPAGDKPVPGDTCGYIGDMSLAPCNVYLGYSYAVQFHPHITVHLNRGDGSFGNALSTGDILNKASLEIASLSLNATQFLDDVTLNTANYTCTMTSGQRVRDPNLKNAAGQPVSDNYYYKICGTAANGGNDQKGLSGNNQFADLDSDGYVDIVSADASGALKIGYGKGDGLFKTPLVPLNQTVNVSKGFRASNQFTDMNGDGVTDLFTVSGSTGTPKISSRKQPGLLASITDGNNLITSITYQPLSNTTAYAKTPGVDAYPLRKVGMPQYVVTASNATAPGFNYTYGYKYSDARVDLTRGWLGFASTTRIDNNTALESTTTFNQVFPKTGRPVQQTVRNTSAAAGKFLSKISFSWGDRVDSNVNAAGKVHFVHQTGGAQTNYEPNEGYSTATALTTTTTYLNNPVTGNYDASPYDQYGNPEKVQVAYSDGHIITTVYGSSYASAPASLHLGQLSLRDTTVTHTTPAPAAETRTRVSREGYYADGLLQSTVVQPNATDANSELKLTTSYSYDINGRLATLSAAGADPGYSAAGSIAANPLVTRQISYNYAAEDVTANTLTVTKITTVTASSSHSETLKYDPRHGAQTVYTDPAGINTTWGYDGFGRKVIEVQYSGSAKPVTTTISLSAAGAAACPAVAGLSYCATTSHNGVTSALSPVTAQYDALGRELRVISKDALSRTVYKDTQYDGAGRVWRVSRPYYSTATPLWASTTYDIAQRPYHITEANGATSTNIYQGLITTVTLAAGGEAERSTTSIKDSQGNTTQVIDALGFTTGYNYGAFGLLKTVTDAKGNNITNTYDIFGNKTTLADPDLGTWQFRYNAFGELKWQKDAKDQTTSLSYDLRGRTTARVENGGVTTVWVYDTPASGQGRLDNATRSGITQSYSYDGVTGQTRTTAININSASYTATTDYDDLGRVQYITYPAAALKVKYGYHPNGAIKDIVDAGSAALYWKATDYNAAGLPVAESWGNTLNGTRAYDAATGALTGIITGGVQNLSYSYYKLGNLQSRSNNNPNINVTETFYYDALNRLQRIESDAGGIKNFEYDALGNLTFKSGVGNYSYGARPHAVIQVTPTSTDLRGDADGSGSLSGTDTDRLISHIIGTQTAAGQPDCNKDGVVDVLDVLCVNNRLLNQASLGSTSYNYTYDNNGNMETGGGRTLGYTAFNMPATVDYNGKRETYGYGPDYSRVTKEIKTLSSGVVNETTSYLGKLYERIDRAGVIEERFYISAGDRLVAQINKTGGTATAHYIHTDMLGSVETVTNGAMTPLNNLSFDAFGLARKETWQDGAPVSAFTKTTRGYTGHETDTGTGLVNMNARLYDPWLGRFVQADSLIPDVYNPQSVNPYSYVLNNPFRYTDPSGHIAEPLPGGWVYEDQWDITISPGGTQVWDTTTGQQFGSVGEALNAKFPAYISTTANCVGLECGFQANVAAYNFSLPLGSDHRINQTGRGTVNFCDYSPDACDPFADIVIPVAPFVVASAGASKVAKYVVEELPRIADDTWRQLKSWFGGDAAGAVAKGGVQANKAVGDAFEQQVMGQLQQVQSGVVQQVTVKTQSGVRTRIDLMGRDANGNIVCTECKASATAPLTRNQAAAFPEIQQSGAVVVGKGKPGFPGGTQLPPTTVDIIRP